MKFIKELVKKYKSNERKRGIKRFFKRIKKKFLNKEFFGKLLAIVVGLSLIAGYILPYIVS